MARLTRRSLLAAGLGLAAAGIAAGGGYGLFWEPRRVTVTRRTIALETWPGDEPPLLVGQITDLHCSSARAMKLTKQAASLLMGHNPDVVFLTGDFITSHGEQYAEWVADALAETTRAPLGAYAVLGNHDYWSNSAEIVVQELGRIGVPVLRNEAAHLPQRRNCWVVGVDSIATGWADARVAATGVPEDAVRLMLVHEPDFADYAGVPVSVQFSGHSHGGQVQIMGRPLLTPHGARKYRSGYYNHGPHPVFVSRGVGTIGPPVRIGCPPEVALLKLTGPRAAGTSKGEQS